jgi:hypothetical protein
MVPLNHSVSSSTGNVLTTMSSPPCYTHLVPGGPVENHDISKNVTSITKNLIFVLASIRLYRG